MLTCMTKSRSNITVPCDAFIYMPSQVALPLTVLGFYIAAAYLHGRPGCLMRETWAHIMFR